MSQPQQQQPVDKDADKRKEQAQDKRNGQSKETRA